MLRYCLFILDYLLFCLFTKRFHETVLQWHSLSQGFFEQIASRCFCDTFPGSIYNGYFMKTMFYTIKGSMSLTNTDALL